MSAPPLSCQWSNQLCEQPNHHGCERCPLIPRTRAAIYADLADTHDAATRDRLLDELLATPPADPEDQP